MNRPSFNVLTEPWIPVSRLDGTRDELGILPCLEQAHELREIRDPAPIIEFGLYRLLVAFVLDALILANCRPEDPIDLKELIKKRHFDGKLFDDYVKHCGDVFDLFHPERPFLQVALTANANTELGPTDALFAQIPSGSEAIHWHHSKEGHLSISATQAALLLTAVSPFMKQGGRGYSPSINGSSPLYATPMGDSLFKTLVLNLPLRPYGKLVPSAAWVQETKPQGRKTPISVADGFTWQPRQLTFVVKEGGPSVVSGLVFKPGFQVDGTSWIDPNLAYQWGDKGAEKVSMRRNRPLWRDAGALALLPVGELGKGVNKVAMRRPDVVEQAFEVLDFQEPLCLRAYGLQAKQANVYEWISSELCVPANLGKTTRLGVIVDSELHLADSGARVLRSAILRLSPEFEREERKPPGKRKRWDKRSIRNLADRSERAYWQHLESRFYPLMNAFAQLDPDVAPNDRVLIATTARDWREAILRFSLEQFESSAKDMDADADALERQVRARSWLDIKLKGVLS